MIALGAASQAEPALADRGDHHGTFPPAAAKPDPAGDGATSAQAADDAGPQAEPGRERVRQHDQRLQLLHRAAGSGLDRIGEYCMNSITCGRVTDLCRANSIPVVDQNFSFVDTYGADEVSPTGTFGV